MKKIRLDQALVERALYPSREQAQRAIMAGQVRIGEQVAQKPSILVDPNVTIATAVAPRFVGRGGLKLEGALDFFGIDVSNQIAVDIGASTGGFTDCLLQRGARKVYAIMSVAPTCLENSQRSARNCFRKNKCTRDFAIAHQ